MINLNKQNVSALEKRAQAAMRLARAEEILAERYIAAMRSRNLGLKTKQTTATPPPLPLIPPPML